MYHIDSTEGVAYLLEWIQQAHKLRIATGNTDMDNMQGFAEILVTMMETPVQTSFKQGIQGVVQQRHKTNRDAAYAARSLEYRGTRVLY